MPDTPLFGRPRTTRRLASAAALAVLWLCPGFSCLAQNTAEANPGESRVFRDWQLECEQPQADGPRVCQISQRFVNQDDNRTLLHIAVGYSVREDRPAAIFTLPLGISLPPGLLVRVDQGESRRLPIEHCLPTGCRAYLALEESLLAEFKAGLAAQVTVHDLNRKPVPIPVSLNGFTAGFNALKE